MATRAVSGCSLFRFSVYRPPFVFLSLRLFHPRSSALCLRLRLGHTLSRFQLNGLVFRCDGSDRSCCAQNLVTEELAEIRASGRMRACIKWSNFYTESLSRKHWRTNLKNFSGY